MMDWRSSYEDNVVVLEWQVPEHALKRRRVLNVREREVHQRHCNKEGKKRGKRWHAC